MTLVRLIQDLQKLARDHQKKVFTLKEMASLAQEPRPATAMALLRAASKGLVARVGNLWINLMDPPDLLEVALALKSPSYLSLESALYRQGLLSQAPRAGLTMITAARPHSFKTPLGEIRFFHLKKNLFFGFDPQRIAYAEKAWLDLIYLRGLRSRKHVFSEKFYLGSLNKRRLKEMAKKFPEWVRKLAFHREPTKIINSLES